MPSSRQSASSASLSGSSPTALARTTSSSGDLAFQGDGEVQRVAPEPPSDRSRRILQQLDERLADDQDERHGRARGESRRRARALGDPIPRPLADEPRAGTPSCRRRRRRARAPGSRRASPRRSLRSAGTGPTAPPRPATTASATPSRGLRREELHLAHAGRDDAHQLGHRRDARDERDGARGGGRQQRVARTRAHREHRPRRERVGQLSGCHDGAHADDRVRHRRARRPRSRRARRVCGARSPSPAARRRRAPAPTRRRSRRRPPRRAAGRAASPRSAASDRGPSPSVTR